VAFCVLASCDLKDVVKTGGTIIVKNEYTASGIIANKVTIIEGKDILNLDVESLFEKADTIENGKNKTYKYDKDGFYTVVALFPLPYFSETLYLMGGRTETVTVK